MHLRGTFVSVMSLSVKAVEIPFYVCSSEAVIVVNVKLFCLGIPAPQLSCMSCCHGNNVTDLIWRV